MKINIGNSTISTAIKDTAEIVEPIKISDTFKKSVITNEKDRMVLSEDYKHYLSIRQGISFELRRKYDIENLTHGEYSEMCSYLKEHDFLTAEEYDWCNVDFNFPLVSGSSISLSREESRVYERMLNTHPDPSRSFKISCYGAYRRSIGKPLEFDEIMELADPSITYEWPYGGPRDSKKPAVSQSQLSDIDDSEQKYNWIEVITKRMLEVDKLPAIKPEDKYSFKNASAKMLDILKMTNSAQ